MSDSTLRFIGALAANMFHLNKSPTAVYIAGIEYSDVPSITDLNDILSKQKKEKLLFIREPDNPHDSNAIRIALKDGRKIGYIPRSDNAEFARRMDNGEEIYGRYYGLITSQIEHQKIAIVIITSDIVFLPPVKRQKIIPKKIREMPDAERDAIHDIASFLPLLKTLKGKEREEIESHFEINEFREKLYSVVLIDRNYRETLEELMHFAGGLSWDEKVSYADYAETKAYLTHLIRKDHFNVYIHEYGTCDSIFPSQIKDGDFIPVIERLKIFADGE